MQSQQAVAKATVIVNANDGDRSAVLADISKIKDPEEQSKARKEAMYQVNQRETAKTEARNGIYDDATKFVADNGSAESYKAAFPERWDKLSAKQQKQLEKGEPVVTDWNTWLGVMGKSDAEIRKMSPSDIDKTAAKLDDSDRDKLLTWWKNTRNGKESRPDAQFGRTRAAQTKSMIENVLGEETRDFNPDDKERANTLYSMIDDEYNLRRDQKGAELTSKETTDMLNEMNHNIVIKDPFFGAPRLTLGEGSERDEVVQFLESKGIEPTDKIILEVYRQAK